MGTAAHVGSRPAMDVRTCSHSSHAPGMIAAETAMTAAVAPSAIPRFRHSPRTANQSNPIPGVTLVNRMSAHAAGQRKLTTIATASSSEIFPPASSAAASSTPMANRRGPVRKRTATIRIAVQTPMKAIQGSALSGAMSWRNAGE